MASTMSLDHLVSWARKGGPAPVELTDASVERITASHEHLRMAGRSGAVYGLTTGVGALRHVPTDITPGDGTSHALAAVAQPRDRLRRDVRRRDRSRRDGDPAAPDHVRPLGCLGRPRLVPRRGGRRRRRARPAPARLDRHRRPRAARRAGADPRRRAAVAIGRAPRVAARRRRRRAAVHVEQRAHARDRRPGAPPAGAAVRRGRDGRRAVGSGAARLGAGVRPPGARRAARRVAAGSRAAADGAARARGLGARAGAGPVRAAHRAAGRMRRSSTRSPPPSSAVQRRGGRLDREPARRRRRHAAAPRRLRDRSAVRHARRAPAGDLPGDRAVRGPAVGADQPVVDRAARVPRVRAGRAARG